MTSGNQKGFTILELSIAVSVFSGLLIVCLGAFMFLGHLYYKGATESNVNEIIRTTLDDISQAIQLSGLKVARAGHPPANPSVSDGWLAYCIGHRKYSYRLANNPSSQPEAPLGAQLDPEATSYNYASSSKKADSVFVVSNQTQAGCIDPTPSSGHQVQHVELLEENMRLLNFDIYADSDGRLYTIVLEVAAGGDASDTDIETDTFEIDSSSGKIETCKLRQTFCAVLRISTTVFRKVVINH